MNNITYRELIKAIQDEAAEHGDHVLDLPARVATTGDDLFITEVYYQPLETATDEFAEEPESLHMWTNES